MARLTAPFLVKRFRYLPDEGPKSVFYGFFIHARHLVSWPRIAFAASFCGALLALLYGAAVEQLWTAAALIGGVLVFAEGAGRYASYLLDGVVGDYLGAT